MTRHPHLLETVKAKGLRVTPQRLIVLSAIADGEGHMNVDEVVPQSEAGIPIHGYRYRVQNTAPF